MQHPLPPYVVNHTHSLHGRFSSTMQRRVVALSDRLPCLTLVRTDRPDASRGNHAQVRNYVRRTPLRFTMCHVRLRPCRVPCPMFTYDRCMTHASCYRTPSRATATTMRALGYVAPAHADASAINRRIVFVKVLGVPMRGRVNGLQCASTFASVDGIRAPNRVDISEPQRT